MDDRHSESRLLSALRRSPVPYVVVAVLISLTVAINVASYWRCVSVTACDVTLCAEEGLVSLNVPLVRLAPETPPVFTAMIYRRGAHTWEADHRGYVTLRRVMASLTTIGAEGGMLADFGYRKGSWQSGSRQGPFIMAFVPMWFVGLLFIGGFLAFYSGRLRFRIRTLIIAMTLTACLAYVLTLRAS